MQRSSNYKGPLVRGFPSWSRPSSTTLASRNARWRPLQNFTTLCTGVITMSTAHSRCITTQQCSLRHETQHSSSWALRNLPEISCADCQIGAALHVWKPLSVRSSCDCSRCAACVVCSTAVGRPTSLVWEAAEDRRTKPTLQCMQLLGAPGLSASCRLHIKDC